MSNLVPLGWVIDSLENLTESITVGHVGSTSAYYRDEGVLFLRTGNLSGGKVDTADAKYITREFHESLKKSMLREGDVLVSRVGYTGSAAIVPKNFPESNCANIIIIRSNETVFPKYLHLFINSPVAERQNASFSIGSAQSVLNIGSIKKLVAVIPPLIEQQKIAAILTSVDEVIEKTQAQIDKLKDLKTAMMQELLLPTENGGVGTKQASADAALNNSTAGRESYIPHTEFKDSPVGRIPKSWEVVSLENLVKDDKKITYGIVQAGPHCEGGVPYVRVSDMGSRHLTKKGMLLTSPEIAKKFGRSAVCAGDIVYALRGMIGHVHIVPSELEGANLTQGTARISPSGNINTGYLLWAMRSPYVALQNDLEAKGSTFKEVTLASLRQIQIAVPSDEEQQFISSSLSSIESKLYAVEDKLEHSKLLKKALMQDLLTGKVRVKLEAS
jgi:type I restriction enzyme S subunit